MNKLYIASLCAVAFILVIVGHPSMALGQLPPTELEACKSPTAEDHTPETVSLGVINGKAIDLVRPEFPPTAKAVSVSGSVFVDVLIDACGRVVAARSRRGHPLLVPASVKAALASTFEPVTIGGNPMQVTGIIVYQYFPLSMTWLELASSGDSIDTLTEYLPAGFNEERNFLQLSRWNHDDIHRTIETGWTLINGKLASDEKARWLIEVGREISALSRPHPGAPTKTAIFAHLRSLLSGSPQNVSNQLRSRLSDLIDPKNAEEFDDRLISLTDNLFQLGR